MPKVLVAMSGGVDSSAAAAVLLERGFYVSGATMSLFSNEEDISARPDVSDIEDARAVCGSLGIDHMVFDFKELFEIEVIRKFIDSYLGGLTPNPCVLCNRAVKFGAFVGHALRLGFDYVATGHYARLERHPESGEYILSRPADLSKDQTYVLYSLTQEVLPHVLFPLGEMTKSGAREIAKLHGMVSANRPDSQDICFIRDGEYARFIEARAGTGAGAGRLIDTDGNTVGTHRGISRYTIGQRRGIGLSAPHQLYVIKKDAVANTITVGRNDELFSGGLTLHGVNIVSPRFLEGLGNPFPASVKIRYSHGGCGARVTLMDSGRARVDFESPQRAVTPGQSAVFYSGGALIGGGVIE